MDVALNSHLKKFAEEQIKSGRYDTIEDVMAAGLARLMQDDEDVDFAPGELLALVNEGEADLARGDTVTLDEVREHFRHPRSKSS